MDFFYTYQLETILSFYLVILYYLDFKFKHEK